VAKEKYTQRIKAEFIDQIDSLTLGEKQKTYLKSRWLDQLIWMENKAERAQRSYYNLKVTVIIAGVILPVLVTSNLGGSLAIAVKTIAVVLGLLVAGLTAVEDFFNYGERWRHYRSIAEMLKAEWWRYYNQNGRYEKKTHANNFLNFSNYVEDALRLDVKTYIKEVVKEDKHK